MFRIYIIILNIEKQLGNAVKRRHAFNQRFRMSQTIFTAFPSNIYQIIKIIYQIF